MRRRARAATSSATAARKAASTSIASGEAVAREALAAARDGRSRYLAEILERIERRHGQRRQSRRPARRRLLRRTAGAVRTADRRKPGAAGQSHESWNGRARRRARAFGRDRARGRPGGDLPAVASARDARPAGSCAPSSAARRNSSARRTWRSRRVFAAPALAGLDHDRHAAPPAVVRERSWRKPGRGSGSPRPRALQPPAKP